MNKTIKEQLEKMENRLNEALDNDLFYDPEYERSVMFPMVRMRKRMISPSKYRQVWKINLI